MVKDEKFASAAKLAILATHFLVLLRATSSALPKIVCLILESSILPQIMRCSSRIARV
jgi:hypothetical protein